MTLREKVKEVMPDMVDEVYIGGVKGCPFNYSFLGLEDDCPFSVDEKSCRVCWNRKYKEKCKQQNKSSIISKVIYAYENANILTPAAVKENIKPLIDWAIDMKSCLREIIDSAEEMFYTTLEDGANCKNCSGDMNICCKGIDSYYGIKCENPEWMHKEKAEKLYEQLLNNDS